MVLYFSLCGGSSGLIAAIPAESRQIGFDPIDLPRDTYHVRSIANRNDGQRRRGRRRRYTEIEGMDGET